MHTHRQTHTHTHTHTHTDKDTNELTNGSFGAGHRGWKVELGPGPPNALGDGLRTAVIDH